MTEVFSVTIDVPKPRAFKEKCNDFEEITNNLRKSKCPEKRNLLPAITVLQPPLSAVALKKEEIILPYVSYTKNQQKAEARKKIKTGLCEANQNAYTNLEKRLLIANSVDEINCVTDYDPTFFMCVKSSTLSSYVAPYKSLKYLFNSQLRLRQEVGYRRDCMLNMETKHKKEQEVYESSVKRCMRQVKYLDDFISADYKKSISLLSKWEKLKTAVDQKAFELQCWATEKFTLTSNIIGLDYNYGLQQKYGRFLYYLSPPSWRIKNRNFAQSVEIEAKGFAFGMSSEEDTFNVIFEKLKHECISGLVKPVLYFKHANDLLSIFDGIEQQHLHHFIHVSRLAPHTSFLKKGIKLFKDIITQDSAGVMTVIKQFEEMLLFYEEQCSQLENKFFKILNSSFYNSVGAPEVLKLQLHLEFCYAKIYNEKPMNLGIMSTAKGLEDFYMDFTQRLELMTSERIRTAIKQCIQEERRKVRQAKLAAKELRLFEQLERALLRSYGHQTPTVLPSKIKRSSPKNAFLTPTADYHTKKLTETEVEYLSLFTDWTEKENPAHYLRSLSLQDDENMPRTSRIQK